MLGGGGGVGGVDLGVGNIMGNLISTRPEGSVGKNK